MDHGSARGLELEWSSVLERGLGKNVQDLRGGVDTMVPGNAFNTRAVTSSGTSGSLVGKKVQQMPGVIGWAALVNSGCTIATSTPAVVEAEQDLILAGAARMRPGTKAEKDCTAAGLRVRHNAPPRVGPWNPRVHQQ